MTQPVRRPLHIRRYFIMIQEIKKGDVFLLAAFMAAALLIALSPVLRSLASSKDREKAPVLEVRVSGKLYGTYDLQKDQTIEIRNRYGTNTLSIRNGTASMTESDCRNQICVQTGSIDEPGQMIVCLPHRLSAEIKGSAASAAPSYDAISR